MKRRHAHHRRYKTGAAALVLAALFAFAMNAAAAAFSLGSQGYVFLHPFFQGKPWKVSLERLDLALPDTLASLRPMVFGIGRGSDSATAVFSTAGGECFLMAVRSQRIFATCYDNLLEFDAPRKATLTGLALPADGLLYVVKDSARSYDSVRIAVPSSVEPLRLYFATVRLSNASVAVFDSADLALRRAGQRIQGVFGYPDPVSRQDSGVWVTGTAGLIRYLPCTNGRPGAETVRDLADSSQTVLFTDGTYAGTQSGAIYRRIGADTFFTATATASQAVRLVSSRGAVGDGGLFKENVNNVWRNDTTLGTASYRFANFIRRPGGFGLELIDSAWTYHEFTYRDTASRIMATTPSALASSINGKPYPYRGPEPLTVTLDDPDSNFSDYRMILITGAANSDLRDDGKYKIAVLSDSADCHVGALRMTSGRVLISLSSDSVKVAHDCALGTLNPSCLTCYWKKYDFVTARRWYQGSVIQIQTGTQLLRIAFNPVVGIQGFSAKDGAGFRVKFADRTVSISFPLKQGVLPVSLAIHDLKGRLVASVPAIAQRTLTIPSNSCSGVLIASCALSDGSVVRRMVPVVK